MGIAKPRTDVPEFILLYVSASVDDDVDILETKLLKGDVDEISQSALVEFRAVYEYVIGRTVLLCSDI